MCISLIQLFLADATNGMEGYKNFTVRLLSFLHVCVVSEAVGDQEQEELDGTLLHDKSLLVISVLVLVYSTLQKSHSMIMKDVSMKHKSNSNVSQVED